MPHARSSTTAPFSTPRLSSMKFTSRWTYDSFGWSIVRMKSSEKISSHHGRFFVSVLAVGGAGLDGGGPAGFDTGAACGALAAGPGGGVTGPDAGPPASARFGG